MGETIRNEISLAAKQEQHHEAVQAAQERNESSRFRLSGYKFQKAMNSQQEEAKKRRQRKAKYGLLDACSTYNHETAFTQARKKGSSIWIFQTSEYQEWKTKRSSSTLLCSGTVGAGKSVLCANVVEDLVTSQAATSSVAYFFCRYDDAQSLKAREIIGSLARQFLIYLPADVFPRSRPVTDNVTLDTDQIIRHLLELLPHDRDYTILVDGLDECEQDEANLVIKRLQSLVYLAGHIFKVFWTGRFDFVARASPAFNPNFRISISPSNIGPEIRGFVHDALAEALEKGKLQIRDPRIIIQIQDTLEAGAQDM